MIQYQRIGKCETTDLDGEWIILDTEHFTITKLNNIGGFCWSLLKNTQTSESLVQSIKDYCFTEENDEQIKKDIEEFLIQLYECGLIKHVS